MTDPLVHPRRGGFGGAVVGGAHDGDPHQLTSAAPAFGLTRESTYLYGTLRDADENLYTVMRRRSQSGAWPTRLWTRSSLGANGLDRHDLSFRSACTTSVAVVADRDSTRFEADAHGGDQPMECMLGPERVDWSEGAILHVAGNDVSPGLQWYLPDPDGSMLYVSRLFIVDGHFDNVAVRGVVGIDDVFLDTGRRNYVDDPITAHHRSQAWCTWATLYDDGSAESGHVAFGPDRFGFGIRSASNGAVDIATNVSGTVTMNAGLPEHASFRIDDQEWEFVVDQHGRCAPTGGPVLQAEGWLRRSGETRRPTVWSASLEVPA